MAKFDSDAFSAIRDASSLALARASPAAVTYWTKFARSASAAVSTRPVSIMSAMRAAEINRATRTDAPPPTKMPRLPSGSAKNAPASATRICAAAASSMPPPMTPPLSAATNGIGPRSM